MAGTFRRMRFDEVSLSDPFFDSLKADYRGFSTWYEGKAVAGESALVVTSDGRIDAFLYLKDEVDESVPLGEGELPPEPRLKIGTLKIAEHVQGTRLGEGAVGLALWHWRDRSVNQVYVTVYSRHETLIGILEKFGFRRVGAKEDGELVMLKDRHSLSYGDAYSSFPYLDPRFAEAYLLPVEDRWHDRLFPYSELAGARSEKLNIAAGNGVSKIYLGSPYGDLAAAPGNPLLIYRIHTGEGQKTYKSAITSFGVVTDIRWYKRGGGELLSYEEFTAQVRNKSVFTPEEIDTWYRDKANLVVVELLYLGYFGAGNNVNHRTLDGEGLWKPQHPYGVRYTPSEFRRILNLGGFNAESVVVN